MKRKGMQSKLVDGSFTKKPRFVKDVSTRVTHKMDRIVEEITNISRKMNEKISKNDESSVTQELKELNLIVSTLNQENNIQNELRLKNEESMNLLSSQITSLKKQIEQLKMNTSNQQQSFINPSTPNLVKSFKFNESPIYQEFFKSFYLPKKSNLIWQTELNWVHSKSVSDPH